MSSPIANTSSTHSSATSSNSNQTNPNEPLGSMAPTSSLSPLNDASVQDLSYFSQNTLSSNAKQPFVSYAAQHGDDASSGSNDQSPRPGGRCYTREELLHIKKSPLVAPPSGMPARKDWFGEFNETAKPKDHDLSATRMRHRRDPDSEDPTRPFDSTRSLFKSGPPQPSAMGSFRHQSYRERGTEIDKDTANLKSIAERYDRERLVSPNSGSGISSFASRVKDRDAAPHFGERGGTFAANGTGTRIGPAPAGRRTEGREPREGARETREGARETREGTREANGRRKGDDIGDWRKGADPARERGDSSKRDPSRSRTAAGEEGDRKRRDRSRGGGGDDEPRRWRDEEKVKKGRDPSVSGRDDRETNGKVAAAAAGRGKKVDDEDRERAEANRRRKEERDKETPAWMDEDIPAPSSGKMGGFGKGASDGMDELQRWKMEKKAKEEQKEREEREAAFATETVIPNRAVISTGGIVIHSSTPTPNTESAPSSAVEDVSAPSSAVEKDKEVDEHKTPRPAKVQVPDWVNAPPLPLNANTAAGSTNNVANTSNPLDALKAFMGVQDTSSPGVGFADSAPPSASGSGGMNGVFGNGMFGSATSSPMAGSYSAAVSRSAGGATAINYDAVGKVTSDFDPPAVSRHAFARVHANHDPNLGQGGKLLESLTGMGNGIPGQSQQQAPGARGILPGGVGAGVDQGLRTLQSAEPSHRTRNIGDMMSHHHHGSASQSHSQRGSQNSSPSHLEGVVPQFANRPPPPHLAGMHPGLGNMGVGAGPNVLQQLNSNMVGGDSAPLFHLPASSGGVGPKDGNVNSLSVVPQSHQQQQQQSLSLNMNMGGPARAQNTSPQQNLLARLGILGQGQDRKASPKVMEGPGDLRMPMPQQHFSSGPPSASSLSQMSAGLGNRGQYGSPVDDRFDNVSDRYSAKDEMFRGQGPNQPGSSASSNYGPSPVGGANPNLLAARGSKLAKFFDNNSRDDGVSPPSAHSLTGPGAGGMGGMGPGGMMGPRHDLVTPPHQQQFDDSKGQVSDLLALLQGTSLQPNRGGNAPSQHMYPEEVAMLRQREMALRQQQQQIREREQRQLEQQLYGSGNEIFDSRGSFVANDLVPGLRPPINRPERDLYNSDRLDDRLAYAAHGRVPGVPGGYDQMMRNMGINQPPRGAGNMGSAGMYSGLSSGQGSMGHLEILQAQQREQQLREQRQRQLARQQEIERAQMLALQQGAPLSARGTSGNLLAQLGPRQNNIEQFNRGGRFGANELQAQQLGGYGGNLGGLNGPSGAGIGGGFGANQLNGFDAPLRQQQMATQPQQQRQVPGMGYGGIEQRYAQSQLHGAGAGMLNQGGGQPNDLMALLLAGNRSGQQN